MLNLPLIIRTLMHPSGIRLNALLFSTLLTALLAQAAAAAELTISIANIEDKEGQLMVAVLASESALNGESPATLSVLLPVNATQVSFSTDALVPGEYAARVMHDQNGNGEMDSNLVGMPTEPWGFSNNAMGNFGPPGWNDVRFTLDETTTISIDLNH